VLISKNACNLIFTHQLFGYLNYLCVSYFCLLKSLHHLAANRQFTEKELKEWLDKGQRLTREEFLKRISPKVLWL
jgi:hypothetical protein